MARVIRPTPLKKLKMELKRRKKLSWTTTKRRGRSDDDSSTDDDDSSKQNYTESESESEFVDDPSSSPNETRKKVVDRMQKINTRLYYNRKDGTFGRYKVKPYGMELVHKRDLETDKESSASSESASASSNVDNVACDQVENVVVKME